MNNQNNKFKTQIECACSMLGLPHYEIKAQYIDYPISIIQYIESGKSENVIEVRFDTEEATITCSFNSNNCCDMAYLFLDSQNDENECIEYLTDSVDYDFKKSCWLLNTCYLKIKNSADFFYFYFFR